MLTGISFFAPFIMLITVLIGTLICFKAQYISNKRIYKYGFWGFSLLSLSWLVSIIHTFILPQHYQRETVALGFNFLIQTLIFIGILIIIVGFLKQYNKDKINEN
ncbi:hypothetical protein [Natranaerobius trueperi]|uniref:Uncharacterized protein n=1 Tax=Natranaerobius trueperi TaxID=759412 RepID=A0A226BX76_9FIRM|nr:hypothetical protein [Natranaerobius trueperi]OWZ82740.1 hypothetical protein CDO51_12485 [Natranaerobius trueperi]